MQLSNTPQELVAAAIAERLIELCSSHPKVAWLMSGGSNITVQVATLKILQSAGVNLGKLTIMLNDERFGEIGHPDSNWYQLEQAGGVVAGPHYIPVLTLEEPTIESAVERYENLLTEVMAQHYVFSQLGMGDDGHISGILPHSPAAEAEDTFVYGYESTPYDRITTTFTALKQFDEIALVAYGSSKWPMLQQLGSETDMQSLPAQVLTTVSNVTIYTDYITRTS